MKRFTFFILLLFVSTIIFAQEIKRNITLDEIQQWNRIRDAKISNNGEHIAYINKPWKGDATLKITSKDGIEKASIIGGNKVEFTKGSDFAVFKISTLKETVRKLKLKKTKKDDLPLAQLGIFNIKTGELEKISRLNSYKLAEKLDAWIAYQQKPSKLKVEKKKEEPKKNETVIKDKKGKKESKDNGFTLSIRNLKTGKSFKRPYVTAYYFAEESDYIVFVTKGKKGNIQAGIYRYDLNDNHQELILAGDGDYKQISIQKDASMIAFLYDTCTKKKATKHYSLYLWEAKGQAKEIINSKTNSLKEGWEISPNKKITFTDKHHRLFFGTAPIRPEKDTTILDEEIPNVDVWHYKEAKLQTVQIIDKKKDLKKAYLAVYHIDKNITIQLETPAYTRVRLIDEGKSDYVLATSNWPYAVQTMWEANPLHYDFYLINVNTGLAKMIKKDCRANPSPSPDGKYLYWYNAMDTTWNTYNIKTGFEYKISKPKTIQIADELNDVPNPPSSYGSIGWLQKDKALLVYDRFDIWKLHPENKVKPIRLTSNGRENNTSYRALIFNNREDWMKEGIAASETLILKSHNIISRADGFYSTTLKKANTPIELISGEFRIGRRSIKAKEADVVVFTKEDFLTFPNLLTSDLSFEKHTQISDANPQQEEFKWGTAELYTWTSLDGRKLEGTLHKPADFDPRKKYPLIVNFYEKSSQSVYSHHIPENGRSTIGYHFYTGNGYIIFNPDVYYKTGYPGEDAFNCVMPGITNLIAEGFIDEKAIGAQGHSWGGYQVAYLATRSNLFAAIESGAPVVNMLSAYGGIRWNTGLNRSFQYEHTQSRIGKTIWESPLRYIENSPIFTLDKINTPILIMHNDDDGYVPWWQGIEFFIGLRRMGKPAWLLNYNNADHWPLKEVDKHDFQIRLSQFFNHYLKGEPMPKWMKEGIPAVDKGIDMGYELMD